MSDLKKVTNGCGEVIEVGKTYWVNRNHQENVCTQKEEWFEAKVTGFIRIGNGVSAILEFPSDPKYNVKIYSVPVDWLYKPLLVSSIFRPLTDYVSRIQRT